MILAIDSSIGSSVAVVNSAGQILAERISSDPLGHLESIAPWILEVLVESGVTKSELSGVAVGVGPGPFTGLRVGLASAKAVAAALNIPVLPVVSHDAFAFQYFQKVRDQSLEATDTAKAATATATAELQLVTDARRKEYFISEYSGLDHLGLPIRSSGPSLILQSEKTESAVLATQLSAGALGKLAALMLKTGREFPSQSAIYLREADVTLSVAKRVS